MGVYSNSRLFNESYVEAPEPDLSYRGTAGANRIISEMIENDMAFFDAVILNDIQEACMINRINEGATDLIPNLTAIQEAAGGGIFAKIGEFLKNVWKKISGLIMSFINKISGSLTTDNKKLVKKFEKQITAKEDALKKMEFKWADLIKSNFQYDKLLTATEVATVVNKKEEIWSYSNDALEISKNINRKDADKVLNDLSTVINDLIKFNDNPNFNYEVYKIYLGGNAPNSSSELSKFCHDYFFKAEETKRNEFHKYSSEIKEALNNSTKRTKELEDNKKAIDKWFSAEIKECEKIAKVFGANDTDATFSYTNNRNQKVTVGGKDFNKGIDTTHGNNPTNLMNTIDGVSKTPAQVITKGANTLKTYYTKYQSCITDLINNQMDAIRFYFKQCRRVWIQAASYSANHESGLIDDLVEALGESADLETDQLFEAFN